MKKFRQIFYDLMTPHDMIVSRDGDDYHVVHSKGQVTNQYIRGSKLTKDDITRLQNSGYKIQII